MPDTNITGPLWGYEQRSRRLGGLWPTAVVPPPPSYTLTPAVNNINEGSALTLNVSGSNITNGTFYWSIDSNAGDFSTTSGSFTITSNAGSFTVTPTADSTTEGAETFTVSIRSGSTSGTILATTSNLTINDTSITPVIGQVAYTTAGTYSWTAPAGVTSVSTVCVGGGGAWCVLSDGAGFKAQWGGGGALAYANSISVTPGSSYTVVVGAVGQSFGATKSGGDSSFNSTSCKAGGGGAGSSVYSPAIGGAVIYGTGGAGGNSGVVVDTPYGRAGGGGAGGYSGAGGAGGNVNGNGSAGSGGGGGGGAGSDHPAVNYNAWGGGGVGIFGSGSNGAGGTVGAGGAGGGGSGAFKAATELTAGAYGGGGPGDHYFDYGGGDAYVEGTGAVRIIWGVGRSFPSTLTTDQ